MTAFTLRPTRIDDVAALPAIERAAGQRFRDVPELAWLADNRMPESVEQLHQAELLVDAADQAVTPILGDLFLVGQVAPSSFW